MLKKLGSLLLSASAGAALFLSTTPAQAYLIAYEPFDYIPGFDLTGAGGGFGWANTWGVNGTGNVTTNGTNPGDIAAAGSLSYIDANNRMLFATGGHAFYTGVSGTSSPFRDILNAPSGAEGSTVWLSFLFKREGPTTNNTSTPFNPYPRAANVSLFTTGERMAIGNYSGNLSNVVSLMPNGNGNSLARSTNSFSLLSLAVVRIDYGATNDTAYLFVNPLLGLTEPTLGSASATTNAADLSFYRIRPFAGNQDNANSRPYAEMELDEIRVGTTWQDVTPFTTIIPEPTITSLLTVGGLLAWRLNRRRK